MQPLFVGIGLTMVVLATALAGVGHYDGVLGADNPGELLSGDSTATFRVEVTGTSEEAAGTFLAYRDQLVLPDRMRSEMDESRFVPVQIESDDEPIAAYLAVRSFLPEPGETLVVRGLISTEWPLVDTGGVTLASMPVVFIHPDEYHEPLIFKR